MNKNQIEVEKAHLKLEKEALKELKATYQKALGDIEERVKALQSDEVLESKIRQLNYQKALEKQVGSIVEILKTDNTVLINSYVNKAYENGFVGTLFNMQNEGIPLALGIDQKQVLTSISKKIENLTFADRLDTNMNDFKTKIKAEITRGIANNSKYNEIARQLDLVTKEGVNSSYRITRTEMGRVSQESKYDCMVRAKRNGADIVKQWDSTMDHRTRESHSKLDGQVKELDEPFEIDGMKAMHPMGFGIASMDINCRCVVLERARWAVEDELEGKSSFTKAVRNKDGMTEIREFNTSSYNAFKKDFFKWQEEVKEKIILEDFTNQPILYHGTNRKIKQFELSQGRNDRNVYGDGIYLTDEKSYAEQYGENVLEVQLSKKINIVDILSSQENLTNSQAIKIQETLKEFGINAEWDKENRYFTSDIGMIDPLSSNFYMRLVQLVKKKGTNQIPELITKLGYDGLKRGNVYAIYNIDKLLIK